MRRTLLLIVVVLVCLSSETLFAAPVLIDFEGLSDGQTLTNQYSGLTFTNAMVLTAGISLNDAEFPPFSGGNVIFDSGGPITINFLNPITDFIAYFTYTTQLTLQAFSGGVALPAVNSLFSANFVSSGNPPNELIEISSAAGFDSITITGDPIGGSFVLDNLMYQPGSQTSQSVPEPSTLVLSSVGLGLLFFMRQYFRA